MIQMRFEVPSKIRKLEYVQKIIWIISKLWNISIYLDLLRNIMLVKHLNRELAIWAEAGIRDTTFEYPPGETVNSSCRSSKPGGSGSRAIRNGQGEQLSLFTL
jgi:hypothetical protein